VGDGGKNQFIAIEMSVTVQVIRPIRLDYLKKINLFGTFVSGKTFLNICTLFVWILLLFDDFFFIVQNFQTCLA